MYIALTHGTGAALRTDTSSSPLSRIILQREGRESAGKALEKKGKKKTRHPKRAMTSI